MLKPFYQGKLDVFCALYAVLNALRLTHNIRALKARDIFNETLLGYVLKPGPWAAILSQQTDYIPLVDDMLAKIARKYPLEVIKPFVEEKPRDLEHMWRRCHEWLNINGMPAANRAIILRFTKYPAIGKAATVRHWTTANRMDEEVMHLFDSSHEAEAILHIKRHNLRLFQSDEAPGEGVEPILHIHPESLRYLRLPF